MEEDERAKKVGDDESEKHEAEQDSGPDYDSRNGCADICGNVAH